MYGKRLAKSKQIKPTTELIPENMIWAQSSDAVSSHLINYHNI